MNLLQAGLIGVTPRVSGQILPFNHGDSPGTPQLAGGTMSDRDDRVAVRTYVPESQRDLWDDAADELDMSRSEFVRTMVQAGRRSFDVPLTPQSESSDDVTEVRDIERLVVELLEEDQPRDWDELFTELTNGIGDDLDDALQSLQHTNQISHSGRDGGYLLLEDGDE